MQAELAQSTYSINTNVLATHPSKSEVVLLGMENETYYSIEGVGAEIWTQLTAGGQTLSELLAVMQSRYQGSEEQIRRDLCAFLDEMVAAGLLDKADAV